MLGEKFHKSNNKIKNNLIKHKLYSIKRYDYLV